MEDLGGEIAVLQGRITLLEELIDTCESYIGVSGGRDIRLMLSVLKQRLQTEVATFKELQRHEQ